METSVETYDEAGQTSLAALEEGVTELRVIAEAQAAKDRELLAALQARPKVDDLRVRLSNNVLQRPNRATRRAMEKTARRGAKGRAREAAPQREIDRLEALLGGAGPE